MQVRKATSTDLETILGIIDGARAYMRAHGNLTQWPEGHPSREMFEADIAAGNSYIVEDEGDIQGTFAFVPGVDQTYLEIEDGAWHYDEPYCAVHRVASAGKKGGFTKAVFGWAAQQANYLRCDTHADNKPMQNALKSFGFEYCGVIHIADGSPRVAFDYHA